MKRIPEGLKRMSKEEFVKKTLAIKEEKELNFSINQRIGIDWTKITKKSETKRSIRW
jgi:hypothetical protein